MNILRQFSRREFVGRGLALAGGLPLAACSSIPSHSPRAEAESREAVSLFNPVRENCDWQAQDFQDSQGIISIAYDPSCECQTAVADLRGADPCRSKGEVFIDLRYAPQLEGKLPLDLSANFMSAQVELPTGFSHQESLVQLFAKDDRWRSQYSAPVKGPNNVSEGRVYSLRHRFTSGAVPFGWTEPGFDPKAIILLGIKFAVEAPGEIFHGTLRIKSVSFHPGIAEQSWPKITSYTGAVRSGHRLRIKDGVFYRGSKLWFAVGGNWRILEYAQNFGATPWYPSGNGIAKHPSYVDWQLTRFENAGIKLLRVGLIDDGRALLSPAGEVTGYNDLFRSDVRAFLDLAAKHRMFVEFCLVDYLIGAPATMGQGVRLRGHEHIIRDTQRRSGFLKDFLRPFLRDFAGHPACAIVDCVNEPEWLVAGKEGGGWDDFSDKTLIPAEPIPRAQLHSFVRGCIEAIRAEAPRLLVTLGVSSKYLSLAHGLPIDYYAVHHYPHFGELEPYLAYLPSGSAWVLEEYPSNAAAGSPSHYLSLVRRLGGSGALIWNLRPDCDEFTFKTSDRHHVLRDIRDWVERHGE